MKESPMIRCRFWPVAVLTAMLLATQPAMADDIVSSWAATKLPPPPPLQPVKVQADQTALLVLDFSTGTCNPTQRPRCVDTLPVVAKLLADARAHGELVVYSTVLNGSVRDTPEVVAPRPDDPVVTAGADKFFGSDLADILKAKHIHSVIVTGTIAQGAVLYTASSAALHGYDAIVPVDAMSASAPFGELATAWVFANGPASVSRHVTLTRSDLISFVGK
jgi:nicotinamidase-related amidase